MLHMDMTFLKILVASIGVQIPFIWKIVDMVTYQDKQKYKCFIKLLLRYFWSNFSTSKL